jgi:hypothetical protein
MRLGHRLEVSLFARLALLDSRLNSRCVAVLMIGPVFGVAGRNQRCYRSLAHVHDQRGAVGKSVNTRRVFVSMLFCFTIASTRFRGGNSANTSAKIG